MQFLYGLLTGTILMGVGWFYHAKIQGYAVKEIADLKARIRGLGGRI